MSDRLNRLQADLEAINDPQDRVKALAVVLGGISDFQKNLRQMRQDVLTELHDGGMSYGQLGALMGISRGRAKQIIDGQTISGRYVGKKEAPEAEAPGRPQ